MCDPICLWRMSYLLRFELLWNFVKVVRTFDINYSTHLAGIAHQFLCTSIEHSHLSVTSVGEVV